MYLGTMVELTDRNRLYDEPKHPYTKALLSAIPVADPTKKANRILLEGDLPSPENPPPGCKFSTRCPYAKAVCSQHVPAFRDVGNEHHVACHIYDPAHASHWAGVAV
jgi:oligopeptide/dipeptide ABC transporter ATP-binding protein